MESMNDISEILKKKRIILGLTQTEVAKKACTSLRSYQRFENGERDILTSSFKTACGIIEALGMSVDGFYHGDYSFRREICFSEEGLRYEKDGELIKGKSSK